MSRSQPVDVVIAGGGVVGATCALALSEAGLQVELVEARTPEVWSPQLPDPRVYALAEDSATLLDRLGVWGEIRGERAAPYRHMRVWDAASPGELHIDADSLGRAQLGWIVEHGLLQQTLWNTLRRSAVRLRCPARAQELQDGAAGRATLRLLLDDGDRVEARIAIAADGADSSLRRLAGIEVASVDYGQRAIVAYVATDRPLQHTAWQRFLPTGPLALLPCADGAFPDVAPGCTGSIVWTLPTTQAEHLLASEASVFDHALSQAFDRRLGGMRALSPRVAFPLRRQLARRYVAGRVLALGDAAHVVHPLAGQGVNLGLRDVAALVESIDRASVRGLDWASPGRLQRWARRRASENAMAALAFDGINRLFSNERPLPTLLRGGLLRAASAVPGLGHALWMRAAGSRRGSA